MSVTTITNALPSDIRPGGRLDELATAITDCVRRARRCLHDYRDAGARLIEAKGLVPHGQWQAWLAMPRPKKP